MRTRDEFLEALADVYNRHTPTSSKDYTANRKYATDKLIIELLCDIRDALEIPEVRIINRPNILIKVNKNTPR